MDDNNDVAATRAFRHDHKDETPLGWAIRSGNSARAVELIDLGHDVNERTGCDNCYPLHNLFFMEDNSGYEIARRLLDNGAHIHVQDWQGSSPIQTCGRHWKFRVCLLLFARGVDLDSQGANPTGIPSICQLLSLIGGSVASGIDSNLLRRLLSSIEVDLRPFLTMQTTTTETCNMDDGSCALHFAFNVDVAKCLVEYGYDPATSGVESTWTCPSIFSIRDACGRTPFGVAKAHTKHIKSMRIREELGRRVGGRGRGRLGRGYQNRYVKMAQDLDKYLHSFEVLPLINVRTMKVSTGLNGFQRFLAKRVYFTTLAKVLPLPDLALHVMSFLSPADVMK